MGFIGNIIKQYKENVQKQEDICNDLISRIDNALFDANLMFSRSQEFIDPYVETEWRAKHQKILVDSENINNLRQFKKVAKYKLLCAKPRNISIYLTRTYYIIA